MLKSRSVITEGFVFQTISTKSEDMHVTIRNSFHGTEYRLRIKRPAVRGSSVALSRRQINECQLSLCGMGECSCGGELGEHGPQDVDIIPTYFGAAVRPKV